MPIAPTLQAAPATGRSRGPERDSPSLFPIAARPGSTLLGREASSPARPPDPSGKPADGLVGIARLAASSPRAEAKRGTEYFLLPVRSILNHCDSERVPFTWTVNPYRGCEFGCRYCYARYTHEYMELDGGEFERKIYVKQDAARVVARDLATEKVWGEHIAIGTATDPYQPAEREFGVTRAILERMAEHAGLSLSITTKSNQIVRDLELLRRIAARSALSINITITTLRTRLARLLEPRAPRPDLRLETVRELRAAGLQVGVFAMPVLPGLTDSEEDLDALACATREAGAQWFAANVLFLMPSSLRQFLPFVEKQFPKIARRYRDWYGRNGYSPEKYRGEIAGRVSRLRAKYGLGSRPYAAEQLAWQSPQLPLDLEKASAAPAVLPKAMPRSCACA